jgi:A/G-specific adenine glycosylase
MLQQTQVKTVIPYWRRWMRELPSLGALACAAPNRVLGLWEGLGYYTRARNLQRAAQFIQRRHGGRLPRTLEQLMALPGIGRYTAGAICSIAFNQAAPVLDGNVSRVLARAFGVGTALHAPPTQRRLWSLAEGLVNRAARRPAPGRRSCSDLNQALMEFGAVVCTPRQPKCPACPLRGQCRAWLEGRVDQLPRRPVRPRSRTKAAAAFLVEHRGRFLVRQRPATGVNAGLWEFPNVELNGSTRRVTAIARRWFGTDRISFRFHIDHSITRHRWKVRVFHVVCNRVQPAAGTASRWVRLDQLNRLPLAGPDRKILRQHARAWSP